MAEFLALFFAALVAISQGAPRPQENLNIAPQQTNANTGPSPSRDVSSSTSNIGSSDAGSGASWTSSGTANPPGPVAIIVPPEYISSFFPFIGASGTSTNGGSANSPLANIISIIPNAINSERERFGQAVEKLLQGNAEAIGSIIDSAATTGGKFLSNGVKIVSTWPTFFGHLIG